MELESLRSRRKQDEPDALELRDHCVSVRLNPAELSILDQYRGRSRRGEALRMLAFTQLPSPVPRLNQDAWVELSKSAGNLNQIAYKLNAGESVQIEEIREQLEAFRASLLGAAL